MPDAPEHVQAAPPVPGQPWDAASDTTVAGWSTVDVNSGPANMQGQASGEFEDGPSPWRQT